MKKLSEEIYEMLKVDKRPNYATFADWHRRVALLEDVVEAAKNVISMSRNATRKGRHGNICFVRLDEMNKLKGTLTKLESEK